MFYYFAYGSCMCPVDLKRSVGESTHSYVIGPAHLKGYRLGFYHRNQTRNCGALDIVPDAASVVHGVLYQLPDRLMTPLDAREGVHMGCYRRETIQVECQGCHYKNVQTYSVVNKLPAELAPNDWYFEVVMRGAIVCGLPESYCWQLFDHMSRLQTKPEPPASLPLVS
ncbi:MAG: gamma-glutamylcyclotransferase family protein [Leptolyngbyaceae bacterium]|nr:gamma-glutamylcyclotransferase family protein [Leptolyngbyaceae bacterium]